jgi:hypothetical protein
MRLVPKPALYLSLTVNGAQLFVVRPVAVKLFR